MAYRRHIVTLYGDEMHSISIGIIGFSPRGWQGLGGKVVIGC